MNTLKEKTVNSLKAGTQNTPSSVKHKFGYKPSALAKENHDTPGVSAKSKSGSCHSSHLNSHLNLNTPKDRMIKNIFSNPANGSSKVDSTKKPPAFNLASLCSSSKTTPNKTSISSRVATPRITNTTFTNLSAKKQPEPLNTIINGVDYAEIIAKKAEYGYKGPGYIIEFDFDPKYMKTLNVEKGFYKARSDSNYKVETDTFDWGPIIFLTRVDKDESKKTPAKMPFSKFNEMSEMSAKNSNSKNDSQQKVNSTYTTDHHEDFQKPPKTKKSLRWADNLEKIDENNKSGSGINAFSPKDAQYVTRSLNDFNSSLNNSFDIETVHSSSSKRKSLRRSFSLGDINNLMLDEETVDITAENSHTFIISQPNNDNYLNLTYTYNKENGGVKVNLKVSPQVTRTTDTSSSINISRQECSNNSSKSIEDVQQSTEGNSSKVIIKASDSFLSGSNNLEIPQLGNKDKITINVEHVEEFGMPCDDIHSFRIDQSNLSLIKASSPLPPAAKDSKTLTDDAGFTELISSTKNLLHTYSFHKIDKSKLTEAEKKDWIALNNKLVACIKYTTSFLEENA